jgi:hypothetical protein
VSCTFVGQGAGGVPPYTFSWTFRHRNNGQVVTASGASVSPELGCGYSQMEVTIPVDVSLVITQSGGGTSTTVTMNNVGIARAQQACGT